MGLCLTDAPQRPERIADIAVEIRNPIVARDCFADQLDGQLVLATLLSDDAEQMQAVRMVRIGRKDLPVKRLSLGELAGLMQSPRLAQRSLDLERRRERPGPQRRRSQSFRRWIPAHPINPRQVRHDVANNKAAGSRR
jgi:hypothetical protein